MVEKRSSCVNINLAIVGGKAVGKSALTVRFLTKRFIGEYDSKADFCIKRNISVIGKDVTLHLKDTTGSDWVKGPSALIGWSSSMVIVYSISDRRSYDLANLIFKELKLCDRLESSCVLLLANKNDLEHLREVSYQEGNELAAKYGTHFYETSAASDYNGVCSAFRKLLFGAITLQTSKSSILSTCDDTMHFKKPSFIRRDSPIHRSSRFISKSPTITDSKRSLVDSFGSSHSSFSSDDELYDKPKPLPTEALARRTPPAPTKRRKISLPTFITRTVHAQKYFNSNKTR